MKTAVDLPDELVREVKIHAVMRRKKLKDAMADLLRAGLDAAALPSAPAQIATDPVTGLPMVRCSRVAYREDEVTPDRAAEILIEQEALWCDEASRQ